MRRKVERHAHDVGTLPGLARDPLAISATVKANYISSNHFSMALGHAARSSESANEIVSAMHAIVSGHRDLNADRAGQYTSWLRSELNRFRAKDAAREASIDANINAVRARFPRMGLGVTCRIA